MSENKFFRVIGKIRKPNFRTDFQKEIQASKPEDAVEMVYKILGSKHKIKRFHIIIDSVEEVVTEKPK
ncbi:MAG: 50S ribosomal protein L18Ae [Candidatus Bathyarchaeia archaeon]